MAYLGTNFPKDLQVKVILRVYATALIEYLFIKERSVTVYS